MTQEWPFLLSGRDELSSSHSFNTCVQVYIESYHTVPEGHCRIIVRLMAWVFFLSWAMFPILFVLGPEGFGHLTVYGKHRQGLMEAEFVIWCGVFRFTFVAGRGDYGGLWYIYSSGSAAFP